MRALQDLAVAGVQPREPGGRPARYIDEGVELADRTGLGWSGSGMRGGQCMVCYLTGDWDDCERLAAAVPERVTAMAVQHVAAHGLPVQVARGRSDVPQRLRDLVALAGANQFAMARSAVREADLAIWQGDLDRARSAVQRALAVVDAAETPRPGDGCCLGGMKGVTVEAERAERARAAGDAAALNDATAVGQGAAGASPRGRGAGPPGRSGP